MRRVVTKIWVRGGWRDEEGTGQRYGLEEDGGVGWTLSTSLHRVSQWKMEG